MAKEPGLLPDGFRYDSTRPGGEVVHLGTGSKSAQPVKGLCTESDAERSPDPSAGPTVGLLL